MQKKNIIEMQKQEQNYWWHISRRFVLKSVLEKHFTCHPELDSLVPERADRQTGSIDSGSESGMTKSVILGSEATPACPARESLSGQGI